VTVQSGADYQKWFDDQEKELQPAVATPALATASATPATPR
jgi:hypothetical protein